MIDMVSLKEKIAEKINKLHPYFVDEARLRMAERLVQCDERLLPNLEEWVEEKEFSDIWIHDKFCIRTVLKIRVSKDFISAFIALDDYAKDESNEIFLWEKRM